MFGRAMTALLVFLLLGAFTRVGSNRARLNRRSRQGRNRGGTARGHGDRDQHGERC